MYWEGTVEITDKGKEFKGLLRLEAVGTASVITYMKEEGKAPKRHIAGLVSKGDEGLGIFFIVFAELARSEEHTSELQSLMRISYAVFCLKKKTKTHTIKKPTARLTYIIHNRTINTTKILIQL